MLFVIDDYVQSSYNYRVAQKSKPLPTNKKIYLIILKPANEIRFISQIIVLIKYYNIIRWY